MTTITGVAPDKENDGSIIVIVDSKLAIIGIYLTGSSLALVIALFVLVVVLHCTYKNFKKAKQSESANIELTGMREFTIEAAKSKHASNIYTSPTHNHHSSEEKLDLM
jgi:hypothetical protein